MEKFLLSIALVANVMLLSTCNPMKFNLQQNQLISSPSNVSVKTLHQIFSDQGEKIDDKGKETALGIYISRPPRRNDKALKLTQSARERKEKPPSAYSWFYLSRKTFYIPLYYQLYFACYCLWVLYRTVRLHKIGEEALGRSLTEAPDDTGCGYIGRTLDLCENTLYQSIQKYARLKI